MAIFPGLKSDDIVQVDDRYRIDATDSMATQEETSAITLVEIEPEAGNGFINVFGGGQSREWFLDWEYQGLTRDVVVSVRVTTDGAPVTKTKTVSVITSADEKLIVDDGDMIEENEIFKFIPKGRTSWTYLHRKTNRDILAWFDEMGFTDFDGNALTIDNFVNTQELKEWATSHSYYLIYKEISDKVDDSFRQKSADYFTLAEGHKNRLRFRIDLNNDGNIDRNEAIEITSVDWNRR